VPDSGAGAREKRLRPIDPLHRVQPWFELGAVMLRQAVDLLDIETRVAPFKNRIARSDSSPVTVSASVRMAALEA